MSLTVNTSLDTGQLCASVHRWHHERVVLPVIADICITERCAHLQHSLLIGSRNLDCLHSTPKEVRRRVGYDKTVTVSAYFNCLLALRILPFTDKLVAVLVTATAKDRKHCDRQRDNGPSFHLIPYRLDKRRSMWLSKASVSDVDNRLAVAMSFIKAVDASDLKEGPPRSRRIVTQPHDRGRGLCPKSPLLPVRACRRQQALLVRVQVQVQAVSLQVWRVKEIVDSRLFATGNSCVFYCLFQTEIADGTADH